MLGVLLLLGLWVAKGIAHDLAAGRLVGDRVMCPEPGPECLTLLEGVVVHGTHSRRSTITTWVIDTDSGRFRIDDGAWADSGLDWDGADVTLYVWQHEPVAMEDPNGERVVSPFVGVAAVVFKSFMLLVLGGLIVIGLMHLRRGVTSGAGWFAPQPPAERIPLPVSAVMGAGLAGVVVMWCGASAPIGGVVASAAGAAPFAWRAVRRARLLGGPSGTHAAR